MCRFSLTDCESRSAKHASSCTQIKRVHVQKVREKKGTLINETIILTPCRVDMSNNFSYSFLTLWSGKKNNCNVCSGCCNNVFEMAAAAYDNTFLFFGCEKNIWVTLPLDTLTVVYSSLKIGNLAWQKWLP